MAEIVGGQNRKRATRPKSSWPCQPFQISHGRHINYFFGKSKRNSDCSTWQGKHSLIKVLLSPLISSYQKISIVFDFLVIIDLRFVDFFHNLPTQKINLQINLIDACLNSRMIWPRVPDAFNNTQIINFINRYASPISRWVRNNWTTATLSRKLVKKRLSPAVF